MNRDGVENKVRVNDRGSSGLNFNEDKKKLGIFNKTGISCHNSLFFGVTKTDTKLDTHVGI